MFPDVAPLFSGLRPFLRRAIVRDPAGISRMGGPAVVFAVQYHAGRPSLIHAYLNPTLRIHVPPTWVRPDPSDAPNVVPFPYLAEAVARDWRCAGDIPTGAA